MQLHLNMNNVAVCIHSSDSDTCIIYTRMYSIGTSVSYMYKTQMVNLNNTAVNGLIRKTDWEISVGESS